MRIIIIIEIRSRGATDIKVKEVRENKRKQWEREL
jgi:hypothetical protein